MNQRVLVPTPLPPSFRSSMEETTIGPLLSSTKVVQRLASYILKQADICHGPTISLDSQVQRSVRLTLELSVNTT